MTYDLFAFQAASVDHSGDVRRRGIPLWRLGRAVEWASAQGFDTILLQQTGSPPSSTRQVTHHVCNDPGCPGGCQ